MGDLEQGMDIHQSIKDRGILSDVVATAQNGFVEKALETFKQMQSAGVKPNSRTIATILLAYTKMGDLEQSMDIHRSIKDREILSDVVVVTALVDMYAKCGSIDKACELFDRMPERNVVLWATTIARYAQNGFVEKALDTFKQMKLEGIKPNSTTFASILPACAKMGALEQGMDIHQSIMDRRILLGVVLANALLDMNAKCGNMDKAHELFDTMLQRDVISCEQSTHMYTGGRDY